jgi:DNA-binding XRE family transcriptional regulator
MLSSNQCRAARAFLHWTQETLADEAAVARKTIMVFESGGRLQKRTVNSIERVFVAAGLLFIAADINGGEGIRRARPAERREAGSFSKPGFETAGTGIA